MAGKDPSAEQLRNDLRKALKLFVRHRASSSAAKITILKRCMPAPPPLEQRLSHVSHESHGLSLPLIASNRAAVRDVKESGEVLRGKALFSYDYYEHINDYCEHSSQPQGEQDDAFDTVARELDAIATAINERYGCGKSEDGDSQTKGYFLSAVSGLVSGAATTFRVAVTQCVHTELPEMHQLALLFHVAAAAMQQVGSDADKAQRITDLTVDYAYDQYGDYIAANGGLENAVAHS